MKCLDITGDQFHADNYTIQAETWALPYLLRLILRPLRDDRYRGP